MSYYYLMGSLVTTGADRCSGRTTDVLNPYDECGLTQVCPPKKSKGSRMGSNQRSPPPQAWNEDRANLTSHNLMDHMMFA